MSNIFWLVFLKALRTVIKNVHMLSSISKSGIRFLDAGTRMKASRIRDETIPACYVDEYCG
jgi:hypothetical protein